MGNIIISKNYLAVLFYFLIFLISSSCNSQTRQEQETRFEGANTLVISTNKNIETPVKDFTEFLKGNGIYIEKNKVTDLGNPIIETRPTMLHHNYLLLEIKIFAVFEKYKIKVWAEYDNSAPNDINTSWKRLTFDKLFFDGWLEFESLINDYPHQQILFMSESTS